MTGNSKADEVIAEFDRQTAAKKRRGGAMGAMLDFVTISHVLLVLLLVLLLVVATLVVHFAAVPRLTEMLDEVDAQMPTLTLLVVGMPTWVYIVASVLVLALLVFNLVVQFGLKWRVVGAIVSTVLFLAAIVWTVLLAVGVVLSLTTIQESLT